MTSSGEWQVIDRFFSQLGAVRTDVLLGIGDDAALLRPAADMELAQTTDSLVEQVHFLPGAPPRSLGHRLLAVNLSDLAAMGATPAWALLSLTLPSVDEAWLAGFAAGLGQLARLHEVALVGGNLSRGPLNLGLQLTGLVPAGTALRRSGARPGDEIWVSGTLGDAALGRLPGASAALRTRFEYPTARVALGVALRGIASSCIDLSDGLLADLPRLTQASGCGAILEVDQLPLSSALQASAAALSWQRALLGGEDYELCFTAPAENAARLRVLAGQLGVPLRRCGRVRAAAGLELHSAGGVIQFSQSPFDHFKS